MRRLTLALLLALSLTPSLAQAKVRVGWLITAIGCTSASVGLGLSSALSFGLEGASRRDAENYSSSTESYYYNYSVNGRYYSSYGESQLTAADIYRAFGWVYGVGALATGVVAIVAWNKFKVPVDPRVSLEPEALFAYEGGELEIHFPDVSLTPTGGFQGSLLHAQF